MLISLNFLRNHWHNILFVVLLLLVYTAYISITRVTPKHKRVIENLANPQMVKSKKEIEEECNKLSKSNCGCHGSCGWLTNQSKGGMCVAGNTDGPYYRSDPIKPGERSINKHYPLTSYEFLQCGK